VTWSGAPTEIGQFKPDMPMTRVPLPGLLADAWALQANVALRDALSAVVAVRVDGSLLTVDERLVRALDITNPGVPPIR
jgi:predicted nucleic acid-binding protein